MKVFRPTGHRRGDVTSMRRCLEAMEGTVVGTISNSMPNGNDLMDDIEALLVEEYGVAEVVTHRKQPAGRTPDDVMARMIDACDAVIVGMGNSGAPTSWCVRDSVRVASAGRPVVHLGTDEFRQLARTQSRALGHADLPLVIVEHPFTKETRDEVRSIAGPVAHEIVRALLVGDREALDVAPEVSTDPRATLIDAPDGITEVNRFFFEQGWSDGLPIVPPTPELVERMLRHTRRDPAEAVASIPPYGTATVEDVAIVGVMAGCHPEYLPVLLAATEAIGDPAFELLFLQNTIHPTTTWLVINGPLAGRLEVNSGGNCFGPGAWANATMGRALRLVTLVIGGGVPGAVDMSTQGQTGKFLMCCAENELASPWEPLHVERGHAPADSTVTVIAAKHPLSFTTHTQDVDDFLKIVGNAMTGVTASEHRSGGGPVLVLSPEHAQMLARAGLSKAEFKRRVWATSRLPVSRMSDKERSRSQEERRAELGEFGPDTSLPAARHPEDILVLVAGGWGMLSSYVPCHAPISWPVTRVIDPWVPADT